MFEVLNSCYRVQLPVQAEILIREINIKIMFAVVPRVKDNIICSGEREYSALYIYLITNDKWF